MARTLAWLFLALEATALHALAGTPRPAPVVERSFPPGWPAPDWSTVPTYLFCGPGSREFNTAELDFIAGRGRHGYAPRFVALGYATLGNSALRPGMDPSEGSEEKQALVSRQIKAAAPNMSVWGSTAWGMTICGKNSSQRTGAGVSRGPCMFEVVEKLRAEPGAPGLLHCNGTLVHREGDGRTLLNWGHNETRALWTAMYRTWVQQAGMDGLLIDGLEHVFPLEMNWPGTVCTDAELAAFHLGDQPAVRESRQAIGGFQQPFVCNDGFGLGNWTFDDGTPMCSGGNFEFYEGKAMDVLGLYRAGQWAHPYMAVVRGLRTAATATHHDFFAKQLAGFLVAAGPHHYFLFYNGYDCVSADQLPTAPTADAFVTSQYAKALGEPLGPAVVHSVARYFNGSRKAVPNCECMHGAWTHEGTWGPNSRRRRLPKWASSSIGGDGRSQAGAVTGLADGIEACECVLARSFRSGTKAYYNATAWVDAPSPGGPDYRSCSDFDQNCRQCSAHIDLKQCPGPFCHNKCVFLSERVCGSVSCRCDCADPACSDEQCHRCLPVGWWNGTVTPGGTSKWHGDLGNTSVCDSNCSGHCQDERPPANPKPQCKDARVGSTCGDDNCDDAVNCVKISTAACVLWGDSSELESSGCSLPCPVAAKNRSCPVSRPSEPRCSLSSQGVARRESILHCRNVD